MMDMYCEKDTENTIASLFWFSMTFQDLFMCVFQDFPVPLMSIFLVFAGLFNQVDIEQVRFSYACTKSTKQQIKPSLTVDNDNVCKGRKHVHGSEMRQPFGVFSMTLQDLDLNSKTFHVWKI